MSVWESFEPTREPPYSWSRLQKVKVMPRSVSQVKEYLPVLKGCGYRYFLNRVVRAWDKPAAWFPMGIAIHEAAEWWERQGRKPSGAAAVEVYLSAYAREVDSLLSKTPNTWHWFASGPYKGAQDIVRRRDVGVQQVLRYVDYYRNVKPGELIWITDSGEPAIELGFQYEVDGVTMRGFIDQIVRVRPPRPKSRSRKAMAEWEALDDLLRLRDIKSGASPGDTFQLKVYSDAVLDNFGVHIPTGDYWMGKAGGPTKPYDLTAMSRGQVGDLVSQMDAGVKDERFDPNPGDQCERCGVRAACRYAR